MALEHLHMRKLLKDWRRFLQVRLMSVFELRSNRFLLPQWRWMSFRVQDPSLLKDQETQPNILSQVSRHSSKVLATTSAFSGVSKLRRSWAENDFVKTCNLESILQLMYSLQQFYKADAMTECPWWKWWVLMKMSSWKLKWKTYS